jgi:hypothetical protein
MRPLAERLVAHEARKASSSGAKTLEASGVIEKLRAPLTNFMGKTGFHALLSRAIVLSIAEAPALRAVSVTAAGALEGLDELEAQGDPESALEIEVVLVAQVLGLLATFIGENLTQGLVREVWPDLFRKNPDSSKRRS